MLLHRLVTTFVLVMASLPKLLPIFELAGSTNSIDVIDIRIKFSRYLVHPDAKRWFVNSNFHQTEYLKEFLNDAMTYAMVSRRQPIVVLQSKKLYKHFKSIHYLSILT